MAFLLTKSVSWHIHFRPRFLNILWWWNLIMGRHQERWRFCIETPSFFSSTISPWCRIGQRQPGKGSNQLTNKHQFCGSLLRTTSIGLYSRGVGRGGRGAWYLLPSLAHRTHHTHQNKSRLKHGVISNCDGNIIFKKCRKRVHMECINQGAKWNTIT